MQYNLCTMHIAHGIHAYHINGMKLYIHYTCGFSFGNEPWPNNSPVWNKKLEQRSEKWEFNRSDGNRRLLSVDDDWIMSF